MQVVSKCRDGDRYRDRDAETGTGRQGGREAGGREAGRQGQGGRDRDRYWEPSGCGGLVLQAPGRRLPPRSRPPQSPPFYPIISYTVP